MRAHEHARDRGPPAGSVRRRGLADLISTVTDAVLEEIATWQARPLELVDPSVFLDALRVYASHVDVRRILYTIIAVEALNARLRRALRARGHLPTDEAGLKLLFLVSNKAEQEWTMPAREWCMAKGPVRRAVPCDASARAMA
jgi:transposase-like protein